MPSWKKLVTSGSSPVFNHITASGNITATSGTGSFAHIQLPADGRIQFDDTPGSNDQFIYGKDHQITIEGDNYVNIYSDNYTTFWGGYVHLKDYLTTDSHITASGNISSSGTVTAAGFTTTGTWTFDEATSGTVGITTVQDSGTSFADNDTSFMTAAAVDDRILDYGYTTNTGDMTGVDLTGGTGITIGSETNTTSGDYSATITNAGVTSNVAGTGIGVSGATGAVTITNSGVTSNVAGALIDVDSATGAVTIAVDLSELTDGTADVHSTQDELVYLDNGSQKRKQISEIKLSAFNNDSSWAADQTAADMATLFAAYGSGVTFGDDVTIDGDLTVSGDTVTVNVANLNVEDKFVNLNNGGAASDGGIIIEGQGTALGWDESESRWGIDFTGAAEDDTTITPDSYVSCVVTADDANYSKNGNIKINGGDIYIYVE